MSNKSTHSQQDIFTTLDRIPSGGTCRVTGTRCSEAVSVRLAEMGVNVGVVVTVLRRAPLGDPIELSLRGYRLCLRRSTARRITVDADNK